MPKTAEVKDFWALTRPVGGLPHAITAAGVRR
jgi:hypothetical protein